MDTIWTLIIHFDDYNIPIFQWLGEISHMTYSWSGKYQIQTIIAFFLQINRILDTIITKLYQFQKELIFCKLWKVVTIHGLDFFKPLWLLISFLNILAHWSCWPSLTACNAAMPELMAPHLLIPKWPPGRPKMANRGQTWKKLKSFH